MEDTKLYNVEPKPIDLTTKRYDLFDSDTKSNASVEDAEENFDKLMLIVKAT